MLHPLTELLEWMGKERQIGLSGKWENTFDASGAMFLMANTNFTSPETLCNYLLDGKQYPDEDSPLHIKFPLLRQLISGRAQDKPANPNKETGPKVEEDPKEKNYVIYSLNKKK